MRYTAQKGWRPCGPSHALTRIIQDIKAGNIETMYVPRSVLGSVGDLAQGNRTKEQPMAHIYISGVMVIIEDDIVA